MFGSIIIECPNHKKIKRKILGRMQETDAYEIVHNDGYENEEGPITDWMNYEDTKNDEGYYEWPAYFELFMENAEEAIIEAIDQMYEVSGEAAVDNYWFQQYTRNKEHSWHYHWSCLFHAIYYVELPEGTPPTLCRAAGGFEYTPNVKEGDILIMPSTIKHCSPVNNSDKRKTIIAVNIDMDPAIMDD